MSEEAVFIGVVVVAALITGVLLALTLRRHRVSCARLFAGVLAATLVWAVGYAFELRAVDASEMLLWANVQWFGIAPLPVLWLAFVLAFIGRHSLPAWGWGILTAIPVATVALALAAPTDSAFRGRPTVTGFGSQLLLDADYGWWTLWVWQPFATILVVASAFLLAAAMMRSRGSAHGQLALLLMTPLLVILANVLYLFDVGIPDYNPSVLAFALGGILVFIAMFRYRLFAALPLAHAVVFRSLSQPVILVDADGRMADFNPAAAGLVPQLGPDACGRPADEILAGRPELMRCLHDGTLRDRLVTIEVDGEPWHYIVSLQSVLDPGGAVRGRALVLQDVTEREERAKRTRELADNDGLTGLADRQHLQSVAAEMATLQPDTPSTLVVADIDRLRAINDRFGQLVGDDIIAEMAAAFRHCLRSRDVAARVDGGTFAVLLPGVDAITAHGVAERLRQVAEELDIRGDGSLRLTVSVAVGPTEPIGEWFRHDRLADCERAVRLAKERGGNVLEATASSTGNGAADAAG